MQRGGERERDRERERERRDQRRAARRPALRSLVKAPNTLAPPVVRFGVWDVGFKVQIFGFLGFGF
jgi:hypothetical protein